MYQYMSYVMYTQRKSKRLIAYILIYLPREVVDAPFMKVFKIKLDEALSNLI